MRPGDMNENPSDLADAIQMITRLRVEIERRPKLTVMNVEAPDDAFYADSLHMVQPGQRVTITLETDHYTFQFTAIPSPAGGLATVTTKG